MDVRKAPFRNWKLAPLAAVAAAVLLLVAGVGISAFNEHAYRAQKVQEAEVQARILAASVSAALAFDDRKAAQEYVAALTVNPEIATAAVYDRNGAAFVGYSRSATEPYPDALTEVEPVVKDGFLVVSAPVVEGESTLGSVRLRMAVEPFATRLERYGGIALLTVMASLVVAVLAVAQAALSRANVKLQAQASALEEAYRRLQTETLEREKAEKTLQQTQKMEAIGQLSGGVAHDFNNLLQALSGCLRMIERRAGKPEIAPLLDAGRQAVERGSKLTQQLMAFARRQALRPEPVDVADRLLGMSELLARALRADIEFSIDLERGLWPVEVDPTQMELAILNLAVNARDAMPGAGQLTIIGRNRILSGDEGPEALTGDHVEIAVSDTGTGMPPEVVARVFEPFFTTKPVGKGTGLGLSQVWGFARQSGGTVRIDSAPGRGTSVVLTLPRCTATPRAAHVANAQTAQTGRGGRVLVVEDDPIVGAVITAALEDLGYRILRASSAEEALRTLRRREPVDLVFSDVVMPGAMNGLAMAAEIRRDFPGLPILLTSGYSENLGQERDIPLLAKPYRIEALADALAELIP